jgi:transposase
MDAPGSTIFVRSWGAVFYVLKSGCQWRLLPHDFPRWPTVYHYYFRLWRIDGTWEKINRYTSVNALGFA